MGVLDLDVVDVDDALLRGGGGGGGCESRTAAIHEGRSTPQASQVRYVRGLMRVQISQVHVVILSVAVEDGGGGGSLAAGG